METGELPGFEAVMVCVPGVPTTVETETTPGETFNWATAGCGAGLVLGFEELAMPVQPEIRNEAAQRENKNTRPTPRQESKNFNVDLP
jgi:hypothetical protein